MGGGLEIAMLLVLELREMEERWGFQGQRAEGHILPGSDSDLRSENGDSSEGLSDDIPRPDSQHVLSSVCRGC